MPSPEFSPKLDLSSAQEYRRGEARALRNARYSGLEEDTRKYRDLFQHDPLYQQAGSLVMQRRWEHLAQKIPEFSEEAWERAGRVFSGINNGVKAALFADIAQNTRPGMYMPTEDIVDHFRDLFAGTQLLEAFEENRKTGVQVIKYCQESLGDVGLLTAKYSLGGKLIGFGVTEEGLDFGLPHALRLLEWENALHESAHPILGQTGSSGETRAPFNCARILEYLFRHPYNSRDADLIDTLGVGSSTARNTLKHFHALGLVDYKWINLKTLRPLLEYAWDTARDLGQARYIIGSPKFQDTVIQVIQQKGLANSVPKFSIRNIVQELPEEIRRSWQEKSLRHNISTILSGLAKDGFLQRVNDFKGGEKLSDITLTKKGRSFIFRIILPALLNSPVQPLKISLSELAQTSAELYYPYSSSNKIREHKNNIQRLVKAIGEGTKTAQELAERVELSADSVNRILSPHIKDCSEVIIEIDGLPVTIFRRKEKAAWHYSLKNTQNE